MSEPRVDLTPLYRAPLGDFLAQRKRLALELKKAGQRAEAERVAKLPKPTPAAWAVNQLLHRCPAEVDRLFSLGADLRLAMRAGLHGGATTKDEIARLEARQREAINELSRAAEHALVEHGATSEAVLARVRTTLGTLSLTGAWGGAEPGQLAKELDAPSVEQLAELLMSGAAQGDAAIGPHDGDAPPGPPVHARRGRADEGPSPEEIARRAAAAALARAEERLAAAAAALRVAHTDRERASRQARQRADERSAAHAVVQSLEARLTSARAELAAAEASEREAAAATSHAEGVVAEAERELEAAQAEVELRRAGAVAGS